MALYEEREDKDTISYSSPHCPEHFLGWKEARNDTNKLRFELIPPEANEALAEVLTYGAQKYGQRNWEKGLYHDEIMGALLRHLHEYQKGNLIDPESGLTHLSHAYCNLAFLITMIERRPELSEREAK